MAGSIRDRLPCITYFYSKRDQRPKTGFEPEEPGLPNLTPIGITFSSQMLWGIVSAAGGLTQQGGDLAVRRQSTGTYVITLEKGRKDQGYVISRFADNSVPFYPKQGTYSRIDDKSRMGFTIRWYDRSNNLVDVAFVFGVYA